jgi:hypothetical protein
MGLTYGSDGILPGSYDICDACQIGIRKNGGEAALTPIARKTNNKYNIKLFRVVKAFRNY